MDRGHQGVVGVFLGGEVGHGHPGCPPAGRFHLDPGRVAAEQARLGHHGQGQHVVHGRAARRRVAGTGFALVAEQARQQQVGGQPAERAHPVLDSRGGPGLQRDVQPDHGDLPPGAEHDRGRLRVGPDVELSGRRSVAPASRTAHDDEVAHPSGQPRLPPHGQRDVGQRAGRHQGELPGRRADLLDEEVNRMAAGRLGPGRRQAGRAEPRLPVHVPRVGHRPEQRPRAARPLPARPAGQPVPAR